MNNKNILPLVIIYSAIVFICLIIIFDMSSKAEKKKQSMESELNEKIDNTYITTLDNSNTVEEENDQEDIPTIQDITEDDIEEIIKEEIQTSHIIDNLECIMQNPELPTGCEITSLSIVLNYLQFDVDKCYLADNYLDKGTIGTLTAWDGFIGNPRDPHSYGCYAPVIVKAANKYLSDNESQYVAIDLSNRNFEDLYTEINNDNPAILWITINLAEPNYTTRWIIDDEEFVWKSNLHCVVMYGYDLDKNIVYISDPLVGNVEYDLNIVKDRFEKMYSQAVIIETYKNE